MLYTIQMTTILSLNTAYLRVISYCSNYI